MKRALHQESGTLAASELVLSADGAIYHLQLHPEMVAPQIILVGDQGRVPMVSKYFDSIDFRIQHREFVTHTGRIGNMPVSVISTGIGTDNIDIVINELDALFNIDLKKREVRSDHTPLNLVRLGTSGALQKDIPVDSFLLSTHGLGLDHVLSFYRAQFEAEETDIMRAFMAHTQWPAHLGEPYVVKAGKSLVDRIYDNNMHKGITATACGFYGPQGRSLRLPLQLPLLNEQLESFRYQDLRITNFEMETSALFGLSALLGHQAATVCTIIANRFNHTFSKDYQTVVDRMIRTVLERLTTSYG